jgi:hypothetical protein
MVQSVPNQQIVYGSYYAQSNEYSMINNYNNNNQPSTNLQAQTPSSSSPSLSTQSLPPTSPSSPSSPSVAATAIQGVAQGQSLQQIPSTPDSFKNNDNRTLQVTSANVISVPGGITQSMTGQVKNTGNAVCKSQLYCCYCI